MDSYVAYIEIHCDEYVNNKTIVSYEDFYIKSGVLDLVKTTSDGKYHYSNIQANEETIREIDDTLQHNLVKTKNKYSRMYKKNILESRAAMDRLIWAQKINNNVKSGFIKILLPQNEEDTEVTK